MYRLFFLTTLLLLGTPLVSDAQEGVKYEPLIVIKNISSGLSGNFSDYVNFLYASAIAIAALLAVVKITIAGVKYMTSEVVGAKASAKDEITTSLLGLLLILGAYIILNTINPQLLNQQKIPFKQLSETPDYIKEPPVASAKDGSATESIKSIDDAAKAAVGGSPSGGCNTRSESVQNGFKVQILDLSGCVNDGSKTNANLLFMNECRSHKGEFRPDTNKPACLWPMPGNIISTIGTVVKKRETWIKDVTTTNNAKVSTSDKNSLIGGCKEWWGKASVLNEGTVSEKVRCDQPGVIQYDGVPEKGAKYDCGNRTPAGTLVSSNWNYVGYDTYFCVIW